jgi:uncharacterized protein YbaP (TraB family)
LQYYPGEYWGNIKILTYFVTAQNTAMRRRLFFYFFCILALQAANTISAQKTTYPNTLLWRISGKDLSKPSYLYGTMHLQDRRIFQFSDSLYYFLEHTDGYAMEVDPDEIIAALMNSLSQPDTSGLLKDFMDEKDFKKTASSLESQFGVPADKITRKQAWLYKQGWKSNSKTKPDDMDAAMDMYLYNIARRQGKWVGGIEDVEDQLGFLNKLGSRFNVDDFGLGVHVDNAALESFIKLYVAQDLNKLYDWSLSMDSILREDMLIKRNRKMASRIDSLAHIRSNFFAVGAAHLPGSFGLIHLLREAGFKIEPIQSKKKVAPELYQYKALELPWYTVENEEKTYEASMPGKAIPFLPYGDVMKMKVYADMGTGILYFITNIRVPIERNIDSAVAQMAKNYAHSGNNVKPSKIVFSGKEGREVTYFNNGYHYRLRLLGEKGQVVLMMTGSTKKDHLFHKEAERFFQSLKTNPISIAKKSLDWFSYTDEDKAIEVHFPAKPSFNKEYQQRMMGEGSEGWAFSNQTYLDLINQMWYMLVVMETKPGYYINDQEEVLSRTKKNLEQNGNFNLTKFETGQFSGYPCMWLEGRYKDNDLRIKIFSVVRGNRNFGLMTIGEHNADTASINKFLTSFRFHDFKKQEWKRYADSANTFTTLAPAPAESNDAQSDGNTKKLVFYDKISGFSFQVDAEALSPYFWTSNDSTFFSERVASYVAEGDSVLSSKKIRNGEAEGMEYGIRLGKDGHNFKRIRILSNRDTVYSLFLIAPQQFQREKEYDSFFNDFRFNHFGPSSQIFTNKAHKILQDLNSPDSATYKDAKSYIEKAPFTKADLPLLHKALLQPYHDDEDDWNNTHDLLLKKVVTLADKSTIDFIEQNYSSLEDKNEDLKYQLLRVLAKIHTPKSYSVLKDLLVNHLPARGHPGGLGNVIADRKELAKTLFPEIITLVSDFHFSGELVTICNNLLDSNIILINELKQYEGKFIEQAKRGFDSFAKADSDYSWRLYRWITLLGKFNDVKSNQLLQQFAASRLPDIRYNAVIELIKNKQVVSPVIIEKTAADMVYRLAFYEECKKMDKLKLFPARYLNQKSIAESELYSFASDDAEPSKMEYIGERIAVFKGKKQKFYLLKITYSGEDEPESYLGVAGPYPLTPGAIITETAASGMYYKATFYPKHVDEQFKEYLKEQEEYAENQEE